MKSYFPRDRYVTPDDCDTSPLNRILLGSRWSLYLQYFAEVLVARKLAVRGVYDDSQWAESSFRIFRLIERNRGRFDIAGIDVLRTSAGAGPFVFVGNHMSTLETQILPVLIAPFMPVTFVVKEQLVKSRVFGPIMRSRNPIAVSRNNAREDLHQVLSGGAKLLGSGVSLIIFPQSTRSPVFSRERFNTLGAKLAAKAAVPVIPFAVKTDFWGEGGIIRGFGAVRPDRTIHFEFGPPLDVDGRGKAAHLQTIEFIESRLLRWTSAPLADPS